MEIYLNSNAFLSFGFFFDYNCVSNIFTYSNLYFTFGTPFLIQKKKRKIWEKYGFCMWLALSFLLWAVCVVAQFLRQSIGASASASELPKNTQCWLHLGLTGLITLPWSPWSLGPSRMFSRTTIQKYKFFSPILTSVYDYWKNHSFDYADLCWQSDVSAFQYVV